MAVLYIDPIQEASVSTKNQLIYVKKYYSFASQMHGNLKRSLERHMDRLKSHSWYRFVDKEPLLMCMQQEKCCLYKSNGVVSTGRSQHTQPSVNACVSNHRNCFVSVFWHFVVCVHNFYSHSYLSPSMLLFLSPFMRWKKPVLLRIACAYDGMRSG